MSTKQIIKNKLIGLLGLSEKSSKGSSILPGKYYDNEIIYISYIENSEESICIIDPYFRENTFRLIRKGLKNNHSIKNLQIITRPDTIDADFKDSFKNFSRQMKDELGLTTEIRVLTEPKLQAELHDRYLITKGGSFNFVSADTVSRAQMCHISQIEDIKPIFDEYWGKGEDLLAGWNKIMKSKEEKKKTKIIAQTDATSGKRRVKSASPPARRIWGPISFMNDCKEKLDAGTVEIIGEIYRFAEANFDNIEFGSGKKRASVLLKLNFPSRLITLYRLSADGTLWVYFGDLKKHVSEERREELLTRLNEVLGTKIAKEKIEVFPKVEINATKLQDKGALEEFKKVTLEFIDEVRGANAEN